MEANHDDDGGVQLLQLVLTSGNPANLHYNEI